MCAKKEEAEKDIEQAIQDHEKGLLTFAQVQKKSNQFYDFKKTVKKVHFDYLAEIDDHNMFLAQTKVDDRDPIEQLISFEEFKMKSTKNSLEAFFTNMSKIGSTLKDTLEKSIFSIHKLE